ncbi:MAG TPA: bifunctional isocitrate dehydrogenase kinase/phosphatase, partial [Aquabacterium sp.]|nr:bifunctional isocitrate dehydrogenase kinase/phosphatase [Aquabacterium sp.]
QPELAETFFNSVTTKILHHRYFRNDFIFVRPAVSTEYIENDEPASLPTYRAYYPSRDSLRETLLRIVDNFQLQRPFADLGRDIDAVLAALRAHVGDGVRLRANFQIQVLSAMFFRNKGGYIIGKIVNGFAETPFALAVLHDENGKLCIDAALFAEDDLLMLFSFARAYFMVDMAIPSAYVQFLRSLMPRKPRNELYSALGLQKQGKNHFYRDFLAHLRHSSDDFGIAPGIKGMVMLVFDLPSFPYVFKVIKDFYPPQKETTREQIQRKYLLVKTHDRVGRMADTLEYTSVAFPRQRISGALLAELQHFCPSQIEIDGDSLVIKHVYIERRMIPLNIYLQDAAPEQLAHAVIEYGNAIKDLVAANIFPGDMLWKNFGVTRHGKVVFYDYDEIEYITDMNFRRVPAPRNEEDELSGEIWYAVGPRDVFPETFEPFLLGNPAVRAVFMQHHADLLDAAFWQGHKDRILAGHVHDVFPYEQHKRFVHARTQTTAL